MPNQISTVEFTPEAVKQYLVNAIIVWRARRDAAPPDSEDQLVAMCYVDAFQSVHTSLFDTLVP